MEQIKQKGSPVDIYNRPSSLSIASFFGTLNQLPDKLVTSKTQKVQYVRPEGLQISKASGTSEYHVKEVIFRGAYHVLQIDNKHGETLVAYDFERKMNVGDAVDIKPVLSKILSW